MVAEINYESVVGVTVSFDKLKQTPNFEDVTGEIMYLRLFELDPDLKKLFGMDKHRDDEEIRQDPRFRNHARNLVRMIDSAVDCLGPDMDILQEEMIELGKRHAKYGVRADSLPLMGRALLYALDKILGADQMTAEDKRSWQAVFKFISTSMSVGMIHQHRQDVKDDESTC